MRGVRRKESDGGGIQEKAPYRKNRGGKRGGKGVGKSKMKKTGNSGG